MAPVEFETDFLNARMSLSESLLSFQGSFRIPLAHVTTAYVSSLRDLCSWCPITLTDHLVEFLRFPADPPAWAMILARKICDEVYAENGEILKVDQVVYGLPGATPGFTAEDLT